MTHFTYANVQAKHPIDHLEMSDYVPFVAAVDFIATTQGRFLFCLPAGFNCAYCTHAQFSPVVPHRADSDLKTRNMIERCMVRWEYTVCVKKIWAG